MFVMQHNLTALKSYHWMGFHQSEIAKSMQRLSSGQRINSAADDPAGMAVSERMKAQLSALKRQKLNVMDGISAVQTADGSLSEVGNIVRRMTDLAAEAANGTLGDADRQRLDDEYQQLIEEIDRISNAAAFNERTLFRSDEATDARLAQLRAADALDGGMAEGGRLVIKGTNLEGYLDALDGFLGEISSHAGTGDQDTLTLLGCDGENRPDKALFANALIAFSKTEGATAGNNGGGQSFEIYVEGGNISISFGKMDSDALGLKGTSLTDIDSANEALTAAKSAVDKVSAQRGRLGAMQNRLDHTINWLDNMIENVTASISRITDADMAKEMMNLTKHMVLEQAAAFCFSLSLKQPSLLLQMLQA